MKEQMKNQVSHERQMKKMRTWIYALSIAAGLIGLFIYIKTIPPPAGEYDAFAQCIASSGAKFYGAYWCPHCQNQKREFGTSEQYLPYIECSLPDASGQTQVCIDKKIQGYPTWYYPDGSSSTGEVSLDDLSKKTGCPILPGASSSSAATR